MVTAGTAELSCPAGHRARLLFFTETDLTLRDGPADVSADCPEAGCGNAVSASLPPNTVEAWRIVAREAGPCSACDAPLRYQALIGHDGSDPQWVAICTAGMTVQCARNAERLR